MFTIACACIPPPQNVRVMQRNLVYVIGLAPALAKEEVLKQRQHFGRFGRIVKVAVNKKTAHGDPQRASYSAYVTFRREEVRFTSASSLPRR